MLQPLPSALLLALALDPSACTLSTPAATPEHRHPLLICTLQPRSPCCQPGEGQTLRLKDGLQPLLLLL